MSSYKSNCFTDNPGSPPPAHYHLFFQAEREGFEPTHHCWQSIFKIDSATQYSFGLSLHFKLRSRTGLNRCKKFCRLLPVSAQPLDPFTFYYLFVLSSPQPKQNICHSFKLLPSSSLPESLFLL